MMTVRCHVFTKKHYEYMIINTDKFSWAVLAACISWRYYHWWQNFWKWWMTLVKVPQKLNSTIPCITWSSLFSSLVMSNSLWPHGLQHARLPHPSLSPGVCSNSCPLSRGCHLTISSSVAHFSSGLLYCWNSEHILRWCQKCSVLTGTTKLAWGFVSGKRFFTYLWVWSKMHGCSLPVVPPPPLWQLKTPRLCVCAQSCWTLCEPMNCSAPGSSVHGISQARILQWVAMSLSRGSSQSRDWSCISCIGRQILCYRATREAQRHFTCVQISLWAGNTLALKQW